jgi:transposase
MSARISIRLRRHVRRRLERTRRKTKEAHYRSRLQIVLLYAKGWGCRRIAEAVGCVPSTAVRVARRFVELGGDGLLDGRRENGEAKVDEDLLQALAEIVDKQPEDYRWARSTWSRELLTKTLRRVAGVRVSVRTMARMLERIGARHGMARPLPRPDWSKARKSRRVRKIMRAVEGLPADEVAYYQDEVDVHLNPKIGRDWMLRGQQKGVITPGKNQKRYLYGALAIDGNDFVYTTSRRKNSDGFFAFLKRLRAANPTSTRIHLVLDNYIIHKSKKTKKYLASLSDLFVLHFLPPYSPEHNRIERLWRDLHANVTRNHRCGTIDKLMRRVRYWLRREAERRRARAPDCATPPKLKRVAA